MTGDSDTGSNPPPTTPTTPPQTATPRPEPSPTVVSSQVSDETTVKKLRRWALRSVAIRWIALSLSLMSLPASLALVWYLLFKIIPNLAAWGWSPAGGILSGITAVFGIVFVGALAIYPPIGAVISLIWVLAVFSDASQQSVHRQIDEGSLRQKAAEDELMEPDQVGLVGLVRYSRVQLESYYRIGLDQTQRSFAYSVMAMWLGFLVIVAAVVPRVFNLDRYGITPPDTSVSVVVVLAGVIIEIISALFLWMYTSSVRNLKYFYDRQMFYHTVLICRTIARDIQNPDEVVKMIIERTISREWDIDMPKLPRRRGTLDSMDEDGTGIPSPRSKGTPKTDQSQPT